MKKMNIALFTAAAMIGSTAAIADEHVDGPNLHGRIQTVLSDTDSSSDDLSMNNWHIAASGSASDLLGGIDASYYSRLSTGYVDYEETGDKTGNAAVDRDVGIEYGYVAFDLGGAELTLGRNDDLTYSFSESMIFANQPRAYNGIGGAAFNNADGVKLTSDLGGSPVTLGVYAADKDGNGVEDTQIGVSADIGFGTLSAVYADNDQDDAYTERATVAGSFDLGVATLAARMSDRQTGENPYTIAVGVPVNASTTVYGIHGADDGLEATGGQTEDDSSTGVEVRTVLGAGLEAFAGVTRGEEADGDSADNMYVGSRWQF